MDSYASGYSSTEFSADESVLKYDKESKGADSITNLTSISEVANDFALPKTSHQGLGLSSFGVINPDSAKQILDNDEYPAPKRLMLWHALGSREYLDVYSSLGVSDTACLLHAESLIVYVCCLAHREGHNLFDFTSGPQTLQFTYRVDQFVTNFLKSKGTVKLVFFEVFKKVFDPTFALSEDDEDTFFDGFLYYRQLLLCYFKQKRLPYLVFDNWLTDQKYAEYLAENEPTCILLEDGSSFVHVFDTLYELLDAPCKGASNAENREKYAQFLSNQNRVDRYCNAVNTLISQSLARSLSVAYFYDISRYSQDYKAFISFSSNTHVPMALHTQSSQILVDLYGLAGGAEAKEDNGLVLSLYGEVSKLTGSKVTMRDLLVSNYLKEYTKLRGGSAPADSDEAKQQDQLFLLTFKCLMLHNHFVDTMSLKERCTRRVDVSQWDFYTHEVTATLDFMCCYSYPVFDSVFSLDEVQLSRLSLDVAVEDVFDANLFVNLLYLLCKHAQKHGGLVDGSFVPLEHEVVHKFDRFYQHFTSDAKAAFFPVEVTHLNYTYPFEEAVAQSDATESHAADFSPDHTNHIDGSVGAHKAPLGLDYKYMNEIRDKYLYLNNSFVNLYYKFEGKALQWVKAKPVDDLVMIKKYLWRDPCTVTERMECIDFHLNFDLKEKQQDLTKYATRRSLQNQSNFSFLLSKYLGSSNLHHPIVIKLEHYWLHMKYLTLSSYAKTLGPATPSAAKESSKAGKPVKGAAKPVKEAKGVSKEKLSKAEMLRMKNNELQETKKMESDTNTLNRLEVKLAQLFNNDKSFVEMYTNILDHTDGPNRAVDLLTDFKWLKSILSTRNVQLLYLHKMLKHLYNCFSSYRLRIVKNSPGSFRKLLAMVLRLIFVYYSQYQDLMTKEIVLLLYTFLHQLNFRSYSMNLVATYNEYLASRDDAGSARERGSKADKGDKKGAKKGSKSAKDDRKEDEAKNQIAAKDLERVDRECDLWDFAIFDGTEFNFMLCYMGDLFERTLGSTNDPRVLFRPDAWQKMLLDIVDARESALVVAPTSTGKTYICYYAMEQVLRLDDHGMVIYVAPNTALALQVTYEIIARFSSKYYTNPNLALSSTFLEKFHDPKWSSSQIVVTVPTILEKLLISMRTSETNFVSRLEYIIFDEVHCIADVDLGTFMERCIHLIPCPFLALSATIGNAAQFHSWLAKISRYNNPCKHSTKPDPASSSDLYFNNSKVHFIQFDERYSDLKLEIYTSDAGAESGQHKNGKERNRLLPFNPMCCITYNNLTANGFPNDVYLTPYDCYMLLQSLMVAGRDSLSHAASVRVTQENFKYLEPGEYFSGCTLITKRQYRYYLETLKIELSRQIQLGNIDPATYQHILYNINLLSTNVSLPELEDKHRLYPLLQPAHLLSHVHSKLESAHAPSDTQATLRSDDVFKFLNDEDGLEYLNEASFYDMLKKLQTSKRLPCLVFILDRNKMEHVLMRVTKLLQRLQWEKFFGTPERTLATKMANKARMDKYQMLLKQYESEKKMRASASKEQREMEGITNNMDMDMPVEPVDVSQDYDPDFYFYNRRTFVNYTDEIEKFITAAANSISSRKNADLFIEALRRGIGIHHEGFPHKFTMLTETLLRLGFLNVIISSKSLAFGINVPCKSVLFCGDNYELTPLMFKQMSGRCGRRGFDLSGHVIFWSIPKKRIKQLLLTNLPTLTTNDNNINLSVILTIMSSFYTLIIKSNTQGALTNLSFLNKKSDDYLDVRDDLIVNSRKMLVEPKTLVQRLSSILNNSLNHHAATGEEAAGSVGRDKIVLLVRIILEILLNSGLLDENGLIRGCYELALLTRDVHPANILLSKLVQTSMLTNLLEEDSENSTDKDGVDVSLHLLEMLCSLTYRKREMPSVLNVRRLVSTKVRNGTNAPNVAGSFTADSTHAYQVAYPDTFPLLPYNGTLQKYIDHYNQLVISTTSKYLNGRSEFGSASSEEAKDQGGDLFACYRARNLYRGSLYMDNERLNLGGVVRRVATRHELAMSTHALELTSDLVPTIEGGFCTVVQLDSKFNEVKRFTTTFDNSYMCDYFSHGRFSVLRDSNGLGQYAWNYLKKFIVFLQHFKFVLKTYTGHLNTDDLLFKNVRHLLDKLEPMFSKI